VIVFRDLSGGVVDYFYLIFPIASPSTFAQFVSNVPGIPYSAKIA